MLGHIHRSSPPRHQSKHALITHRDVSSELSTSGSKAGTAQDSFREPEHTSGGHRAALIAVTTAQPWGICPGKRAKAASELSKSPLPGPIWIVGPQSPSYAEGSSASFLLERSNLLPWQKKGGISVHNLLQVLLFIGCTRKTHAKFSSLKQWASNCGTQHLLLTPLHPYLLHAKITMLTAVTQPSTYFRYFYLKITLKIIWGICKMPRKDVSTDLRTMDTDGLY